MDDNPYRPGFGELPQNKPGVRLLLAGFILFGTGIAIEECSRFALAASFYKTLTVGNGVSAVALAEVF